MAEQIKQGKIGVTTENIFPVIKQFLYSDHEIFLRELVSNAVDATQKLRTLASFGEFKGDTRDLAVRVTIDAEAGTLTVSDNGVGMTAEEIDKYINQIAFSGAEEFVKKFKDTANAIIGHFGLGFYSAFMVAKRVQIRTLSYAEGAEPVMWECDGSPAFTMQPYPEKSERGTDIVLYIDDENRQFLEQPRIDLLLKKYCRFLPVPVISGKEQEWKDGKMQDTDRDNVVNATEPLWTKKPSELTDDDYRAFYRELYPGQEDPLFWIHLNVDYPFTLTGVLFFPKIKNNLDIRKDRIQLYCNQVYVTDSVEGVVPEFMTLLQGVIDSPDIPLNVSRSYLQSDTAVKKISGYITKKVADRLAQIFRDDRADFEKKWDDIKIFIEYGMLTDPKFADAALKFTLLRDTDGRFYTLDEYRELTAATQTDKEGALIILYTTDPTAQYAAIEGAHAAGYNVTVLDGQLDPHFIGLLESKMDNTRFVRVDADTPTNLIPKGDTLETGLDATHTEVLSTMFRDETPRVDKAEFLVTFQALDPGAAPVAVTQNEYMRRMKEMAAMQPGMAFYGELPDSYNLVVNTRHPLVERLVADVDTTLMPKIADLNTSLTDDGEALHKLQEEKDAPDTEKRRLEEKMTEARTARDAKVHSYAEAQPLLRQLIDLALLGAGLLRGEALSRFIARSVTLLEK